MSKKILLVEDEGDWRAVAGNCLAEAGYQVRAVANASEALLLKDERDMDLIILDLDLGGENGLMLMQHLKRNHPHARILLYTGIEHNAAAVQQMLKEGAQRYARKGKLAELLAAVREELGQ